MEGEHAKSGGGWRELAPPIAAGSFAPDLAVDGGDLLLTWLERPAAEGEPHRVRFSRLTDAGWSPASTIVASHRLFANWADFPAVAAAADGSLTAHWLGKTGEETYAYSIFLARSRDGGATWEELGVLNDDATDTEHGFVSWVAEGQGLRAFWLDGREMAGGGAMTLRTAAVGEVVGPDEVLDSRVCECCATGAAVTAAGPLVVYRDRGDDEIRDVAAVGLVAGGWSLGRAVAADGWKIAGCPVNGPAIAAEGELAAVAWFTAAGDSPRVQATFSSDGGRSFGATVPVDLDRPHGRVDLVADGAGGAVVSWLARVDEARAAIRLLRLFPEAEPGEPLTLAETGPERSSGFPRLARIGERLFLAWVDTQGAPEPRVRMAEVPVAELR